MAEDSVHVMQETPFKPLSEMAADEKAVFHERQEQRQSFVKENFSIFEKQCLAEATAGLKVGLTV